MFLKEFAGGRSAEELAKKNYEIGENSSILELFLMERNNRKYDSNDPIFDDVQLRHLLADLFGAGVDTTLSTMRWILLYVSQDRDIKRKIKMVCNDFFVVFVKFGFF